MMHLMVSNNIVVTFKIIEIGIPNISFSFGSKGASNMGSNISISSKKNRLFGKSKTTDKILHF